jgi:hypothetical protein
MPRATAPREKAVVEGCKTTLKRRQAFAFKTQSGGYGGMVGIPDLICCYRGYFLAIEVKRPGSGSLTEIQRDTLKRIAAAGGVAVVVDHKSQVDWILDRVDEGMTLPGATDLRPLAADGQPVLL